MDDHLLDVSWTLHRVVTNDPSYHDFFTYIATQTHLTPYINRLDRYLATHKPQYVDDLDDEREKLGVLKACEWVSFTTPTTQTTTNNNSTTNGSPPSSVSRHYSIQIIYQNQLHRYILFSPYLILSKSPPSHTRKLLDFLSETFNGLLTDHLKLPPTLLSQAIADTITTIVATVAPSPEEDNNTNDQLTRLSHLTALKPALGTLKLTISFTGPIAPNLRTIDIDIPYETVATLVTSPSTSTSTPTTSSRGLNFLTSLTHHLHSQTGLILPLLPAASHEDPATPFHISKITTASMALSVEGKMKFSVRDRRSVDANHGDVEGEGIGGVIRRVNMGVLSLVDFEARRRLNSSDE